MVPVLFHFAGYGVGSHDFFVVLGVICAVWVFAWMVTHQEAPVDPRMWWLVAIALATGGLFARLGNVLNAVRELDDPTPAGVFLLGGKSVLGGLAGAYVGVLIGKRIIGYRQSTGDLFAPAVALGLAVGRVGCFLTEQVGTATSLPWGISVSPAVAARIPVCDAACAAGRPMHPSFLYEIGFHLAAFGVLMAARKRPHVPGDLFKGYLVAYGVVRFIIEFVRGNPREWLGLTGSQLFLLVTMPLGIIWFVHRRSTPRLRPAGVHIARRAAP